MSPRVEHIGDATLYLGDCRDILPMLGKVDAVVTDPVWPNVPAGLLQGSDDPWLLFREMLAALGDVQRIVTVMRCDSDPRFLSEIPSKYKFFRSIQLPYVMPGYLGRVLGGDETAYWFGEPIAWANGRRVVPGRAPPAQPGRRPPNGHPCSRCQDHFDWLLNWSADAGEVVLDPFMGSGTTGVSCVKLGLPFVGVEIEERYFDIACERIAEAERNPPIFRDSRPVPSMFDGDAA